MLPNKGSEPPEELRVVAELFISQGCDTGPAGLHDAVDTKTEEQEEEGKWGKTAWEGHQTEGGWCIRRGGGGQGTGERGEREAIVEKEEEGAEKRCLEGREIFWGQFELSTRFLINLTSLLLAAPLMSPICQPQRSLTSHLHSTPPAPSQPIHTFLILIPANSDQRTPSLSCVRHSVEDETGKKGGGGGGGGKGGRGGGGGGDCRLELRHIVNIPLTLTPG
ncbi:hypothetical protein E2C01_056486 [Portunus trituberculatus]|uniref:Uncharacterized protein n=1 Tax=Portunus trituberculatus TaxID=210409 RepID=A0A5B7GQG4_PORTR|nr:hypothetical protein [Portunus trituberculatus]